MFSFMNSRHWLGVSKGHGAKAAFIILLASAVNVAEGRADWKAEWESTLQAAREEGQVMFYASNRYDGVIAAFQKRYPGIKMRSVIGGSGAHSQRIMAERRARKPIADLYTGAVSNTYKILYKGKAFAPIRPNLILPEVVDKSHWWKGKHKYLDDESKYVFVFNAQAQPYFTYNSNLVDPNEIKSYWDLLDPKWKGKLLMVDPTTSGGGNGLRLVFYSPELGPEFLRRILSEMDAGVSRDNRQIVDWLAVGKYAIGVFTNPRRLRVHAAKQQGLPIDWFKSTHFKEGVLLASITGNVGILDKAPHPNAARVALNWLLSREGQIAFQKYVVADSRRIDIPKDDVPTGIRRMEGIKYVIADTPERLDLKPIMKIVKEAWRSKR